MDRNLGKRIAANHRTSGFSHSWRKPGAVRICDKVNIRELLEQSLAQERPVSAHHMAANLGYANDGYLQRTFPDLCRGIGQKIAVQRGERLACMEKTLRNALEDDPVPTLNDLRKRLGWSLLGGPTTFAQVTVAANAPPQIFIFAPVQASFFRFTVLSNWGDTSQTGFAEVAFDAVPEPSTLSLAALGMLALGYHLRLRRRRR